LRHASFKGLRDDEYRCYLLVGTRCLGPVWPVAFDPNISGHLVSIALNAEGLI
jgi:hypothetical protein